MSSIEIMLSLPFWSCLYGSKMEVHQLDEKRYTLVLSSEAADVVIRKASTVKPNGIGWILNWKIKNSFDQSGINPEPIVFSNNELEKAFGISNIDINIDPKIKKAVNTLLNLPE